MKSMFYFPFMRMSDDDDDDDGKYTETIHDCMSCLYFITARCYASAVLAPLSVRVCVRLSQVRVLLKQLYVGSHKQHHTIAQGL